jgi:hypothetical protein
MLINQPVCTHAYGTSLAGLEMTMSIAQTPRRPALDTTRLTETSALCRFDPDEKPSTAVSRLVTTSRSVEYFRLPFNSRIISAAYTRKTKIQQVGQKTDGQDKFPIKEHVLCLSSTILGFYISICFKNPYGSISHSLQVDPVADYDAPIFDLCEKGDIPGIQDMFARRIVSPFVRNPDGWTLLHVSITSVILEQDTNDGSMQLIY